ncbi:MAG TPA: S4 domain-containing protein [Gammaproteobacteria bacterium]|nr:S4 domain-containing protein [Gammaproteobacteria bacterium]
MPAELESSQRLDKWLWAARFFKTRNTAAAAISGGKVQCDGERVKPARRVRPGTRLSIRRGPISWEVVVVSLSNQRRPAKEAALLYTETESSIRMREAEAERRRQRSQQRQRGLGRPTKRERRQLQRLKERL